MATRRTRDGGGVERLAAMAAALLALGACGSTTLPSAPPPGPSPAVCAAPGYVPTPTVPWPCPPAAEVHAIAREVPITFEEDPTAGVLVCAAEDGSADLTRLQERVFQALYLMKRVRFDAPLPWTDQTLWQWFVHEVRGVRMGGSQSYCCEPARVIVLGVSSGYTGGFPTLVEGLVHEARHADSVHPHSCGTGADQTIAELGAYGVQYYLNLWLGEHSLGDLLSPEERRYSANRAEEMHYYSFCRECRR